MSILNMVTSIFKPAAELVDALHTSDEERMKMEAVLKRIEFDTAVHMMDYEKQLLAGQTSIIVAEAQGGSWLQRSWRPITMLTFLALVVCDSFGWLANPLAEQAWTLLQIGLGGYVVGRSVEKTVPKLINKEKGG